MLESQYDTEYLFKWFAGIYIFGRMKRTQNNAEPQQRRWKRFVGALHEGLFR